MDLRLDESLDLELGFLLDRHLQECPQCELHWQSAMQIEEGFARMPEPPLARLNVQQSLARIREARHVPAASKKPTTPAEWTRWRFPAAALAASLLVIIAVKRDATEQEPGESPLAKNGEELVLPTHEPQATEHAEERALAADPTPDLSPEGKHAQIEQRTGGATSELASAPATPDAPLDDSRLARARVEVRERLLSAYERSVELVSQDGSSANMTAFAEEVDELTLALRKQSWPIVRITEGLLKDPEPKVAQAAATYIGLRGDRSSIRRLSACLELPHMARAVTLALASAGPDGLQGLGQALCVPSERTLAADLLIAKQSPAAAAQVAEVLAKELRDQQRATDSAPTGSAATGSAATGNDLLEVLVAMQQHSLPALIELGQEQLLSMDSLLACLEEIRSTGSYLVSSIYAAGHPDRRRSGDLETMLLCASRFAPSTAGHWLSRSIDDRDWKDFCLEQLPRLQGVSGVEILVRLDGNSAISTEDLDALFEQALAFDSGRFVDALKFWRQNNDPDSYSTVARRMLSVGTDATIPVLRALLETDRIPLDLQSDLVALLGTNGDPRDLPSAVTVFERCGVQERQLAATTLLAIHQLGGEAASSEALIGAEVRDQQNILLLLRRLQAEARTTSSLYKLARELRPFLSARALATRSSS